MILNNHQWWLIPQILWSSRDNFCRQKLILAPFAYIRTQYTDTHRLRNLLDWRSEENDKLASFFRISKVILEFCAGGAIWFEKRHIALSRAVGGVQAASYFPALFLEPSPPQSHNVRTRLQTCSAGATCSLRQNTTRHIRHRGSNDCTLPMMSVTSNMQALCTAAWLNSIRQIEVRCNCSPSGPFNASDSEDLTDP